MRRHSRHPAPAADAGQRTASPRNARRYRLLWVVVWALVFLLGPARNGLCQLWMTPQYSTYASATTDGTYVYTSVTVDGYTSGTCSTQPAYLANECHSTTHTPKLYNTISTAGGWETGGSVYWSSYLSDGNSQQMAAVPGDYTFSSEAEVICSAIGGAIYSATGSQSIKIGNQQVQFYWDTTQPPYSNCYYANNCEIAPAGSYCGPAFFTTSYNKAGSPYCYIYDSRRYFFVKIGSSLHWWQTDGDYPSDKQTDYPCDSPIP